MGDAIKQARTTRRHEYVLRSPTNAVEMDKAIGWASADKEAALGKEAMNWDDAISVEARDDEVVIYWTEDVKS